jgi:hypothetical protein
LSILSHFSAEFSKDEGLASGVKLPIVGKKQKTQILKWN